MKTKQEIIKMIKKHWIMIWIAVAAVSLCGILVYAKFEDDHNIAKRVISAGVNEKTLFTSNYLKDNNPKYPKTTSQGDIRDQYFEFSIYNYDRSKPTSFYPTTINYTLKAELVKLNNSVYSVYDTSDDATELSDILDSDSDSTSDVVEIFHTNGSSSSTAIISLNTTKTSDDNAEQLVPNQNTGSAVNTYKLVLPSSMLDKNMYVRVTATPVAAHSDIFPIEGTFYIKTNTVNLTTGWEGMFNDNQSTPPSGYDAFNYAISGNGNARKILSWDNTLLEPNKQQIKELFGIDLAGTESQITVNLSSADNGGRYDIQFYVKSESARNTINGYNWTTMSGKVTLTDPT